MSALRTFWRLIYRRGETAIEVNHKKSEILNSKFEFRGFEMKTYHKTKLCMIVVFGIMISASIALADDDSKKNDVSGNAWPLFRGNRQLTGVVDGKVSDNPQPKWVFKATDAIESTAAIQDGTVYVGSLDGYLYAVDFDTGKLKWKAKASSGIKASPTVYKGAVYFGDEYGYFRAVNAANGDSLWRFETEGEIISSANFYEGRVLFGSYDNSLYCLSAQDGELLWRLESEGYIHGTPAIVDGKVFTTGCDGFFRALDIATGKEVEKVSLGDYVAASPAILNKQAFFGTFGNKVICLNLQNSEVKWRYEHPKRKFPFYSSAAVTPDLVVVGGRDKMLHALDAGTGQARWTFSTRAKIESSPVIVGGRVIFASASGKIYILDINTGKALWEYDSGASIVASPSYAHDRFVIGNDDGVLMCFE